MGYTLQRSLYDRPFECAENSHLPAQRRMFRTPNNYGYITSTWNVTPHFRASLFGTYTGSMLVQHTFYNEQTGSLVDSESVTPDFFDLGLKLAYTFRLSTSINLEVSAGVKNIFNSYQKDLDFGPMKDAGYVYGPALPRMFFAGLKLTM